MRTISVTADDEQHGFLVEALQSAIGEAEDALERHTNEEPPLYDLQTIGEAAEDYANIVAIQRRRLHALNYFLEEVNK